MTEIAVGFDLGGTQMRAALVDKRGNVIARDEERTDAAAGPDRFLGQMKSLKDKLLLGVNAGVVAGVGVYASGPLDTETGVAHDIPTLNGFADHPIAAELRRRLSFPVSVGNDGISAAIGEWRFGVARTIQNALYVTVSTGIGGGAILDGRVLRRRKGVAGHIGHMSVVPDGAMCPCGNRGYFEAYGSGTAFTERARHRAFDYADASLLKDTPRIDSRSVLPPSVMETNSPTI
jgi:glucokinase